MNPLITIATVTYNAEATLERTLESVAQQDYARIEHLIIDGCSTDHTLSLVGRYVEQNQARHNIRLICEPDNGLYDAMNKALLNATGEYIVFLNAGDRLHSTDTISAIARQTGWVKGDHRHPAILYGDTHLVDAEGNFLRRRRLTPPKELKFKSFLDGMRVCHKATTKDSQHATCAHRLPQRRHDDTQPPRLAHGASAHHGALLRLARHRATALLVHRPGSY